MDEAWLLRLQTLLCSILFLLIILGAGVRLADAGLACPDWPLCHGQAIPSFNFKIFMEWIHRVIAASVGCLGLAMAVFILLKHPLRQKLGVWALISLFLFGIQAFLGRQTVTELLRPEIVNSHLVGGYLLLAVNLWILMKLRRFPESLAIPTWIRVLLPILSFFIFFQATVGGTVSSHYAGLACPDFPKCQGQWIPELTGLIAIRWFHQVGAFLLFFLTFVVAAFVWKQSRNRFLRNTFLALGLLIALQISLGISMVFTLIHPALSLLHSAVSITIFSLYILATFYVYRLHES